MNIDKELIGFIDSPRNKKLIATYRDRGSRIVLFPENSYMPAELTDAGSRSIAHFEKFHWLIFIDPASAGEFLERVEESGRDLFDLDLVNVCSFGEPVADELRFRQVHTDVIPHSFEPSEVVNAIQTHAGLSDLSGLNILVMGCGKDVADELKTELKSCGADAEFVKIANGETAINPEYTKSNALLHGGSVDQFVFGNPRDVYDLVAVYGMKSLQKLKSETRFQATDAATEILIGQFGLSNE